jgi:transcriptional regulator with PAS, ATPase and Fis domain
MKKFERVGENRSVNTDVRVITATNRNLLEMISQGHFREDLFFRINVVPIYLPPLRERREDIPLLVEAFILALRARDDKSVLGVAPDVMNLFFYYHWPGNIRELKSVLEYAFVIAPPGLIKLEHLPAYIPVPEEIKSTRSTNSSGTAPVLEEDIMEKAALMEALRLSGGNKSQAAKILGVHRMTVWNRMRKHGIHLTKNIDPT